VCWPNVLLHVCPNAQPVAVAAFGQAATAFERHQITTPLRQAHFLAQASHETGGFRRLEESLNYSAERLLAVFARYIDSQAMAERYERRPEALANLVYDDRNPARRNKLGNVQDGDGWRYRGRGIFQLTGRSAYREMGRRCGLPLEDRPELVNEPQYMLAVACSFWAWRGLNLFADEDDLMGVTVRVNGGQHGLSDRAAWLVKWKEALDA